MFRFTRLPGARANCIPRTEELDSGDSSSYFCSNVHAPQAYRQPGKQLLLLGCVEDRDGQRVGDDKDGVVETGGAAAQTTHRRRTD
jgi:hypothetical protein